MSITAADVNNFVKQEGIELVTTAVDIPAIIIRCEKDVVSYIPNITGDDKDNLVLKLAAFYVFTAIGEKDRASVYWALYEHQLNAIKGRTVSEATSGASSDGIDTGGIVTIGRISSIKDTRYESTRTETRRRY